MIKSKLPKEVLFQMELRKDPDTKWEVESLRKCLRSYIVARERSEQDSKPDVSSANYFRGNIRNPPGRRYTKFESSIASNSNTAHSAEALVATSKGNGYSDKCRYCQNRHWSDECTKYKTTEDRKKQLKDSCYKCLKVGHKSRDFKSSKVCVHCGASDDHHRSLCPKKFPKRTYVEHAQLAEEGINSNSNNYEHSEEKMLISLGE